MDELERIKKEKPETYRTIELDLCVPRENEVIKFEGNSITPLNIEGNITIRLNNPSNSPIPLERVKHLQTPFYEIYVTNSAQPNKKASFILGSYSKAIAPCVHDEIDEQIGIQEPIDEQIGIPADIEALPPTTMLILGAVIILIVLVVLLSRR